MTLPTVVPPARAPSSAVLAPVRGFIDESLAPSTRRAYKAAMRAYARWCDDHAVQALPACPEAVAAFLAAEAGAGRKVATLEQRVAAIRWAHEAAGHETRTTSKIVRACMAGIRRKLGVAPTRKAPLTVERLAAVLAHVPANTMNGLRDRALLLFGFASAMRRSELAALNVQDLELTSRGLLVTVRRSKTDQVGTGHQRAIPLGKRLELCPVRALAAWLEAAGIGEGRLFRSVNRHGKPGESLSARAIGDVVKRYARSAGLDPREFAGHSLRAGFVTSATERGARAERIMDHTGHRSAAMVRIYTRRSDAFSDHAGEGLL